MDSRALIEDFNKVAELAGIYLSENAVSIERLDAPHRPPSTLPCGKMAVYVFNWNDRCLKVGKVGPKSQARYTSQHYNPASSKSNLARSILSAREALGIANMSESNIGFWIKENIDRENFLIDASCGMPVLTLLESFLHCRLRPMFEGFESQR